MQRGDAGGATTLMPKFVFQLEGVLRHRKTLEEQRQRELGVAQTELAKMQAELRSMDEAAQGVSSDVRDNRLTGTLDMAFLAAHRRYVLAMQRKALALAQRMAAQQQAVDAARRQLERWRSDHARREGADLDEVNMQLALEPYFRDVEG